MSEEVYIPITPATRIPFPCWLWDNKDKFWFKASECWQGCTERHNITHYCTSATEPTGRPGEKDDDKVFRKKFVATLEGSTEDASTTVPTGRPEELQGPTEDGYANYHDSLSSPAVPTASGASGEAHSRRDLLLMKALTCAKARITHLDAIHETSSERSLEIIELALAQLSATASRPAVAQEGVRDTERLDWLEANSAGLNDAYSPPGPHVWVNLMGEIKHFYGKSYRAVIDRAMSSQPEGRV